MKNLGIEEIIGFQVESTAEWRRSKFEQFPDDERNSVAAEELDRLAAEVRELDGGYIHQQINELSALADEVDFDYVLLTDIVAAELRSIGFQKSGTTGSELLDWYRNTFEGLLRDCVNASDSGVAAPVDLAEQVENDPAVKEARLRYEAVRAKAYAEARKRI